MNKKTFNITYRYKGGSFEKTLTSNRSLGTYEKCPWFNAQITRYGLIHCELSATHQHERNQRIIDFMDATGLIPSDAWRSIFKPEVARFEAWDHPLVWRQPDGRYIVTTEPYWGRKETPIPPNGWAIAPVEGFGIWNPPHTKLFVLSLPKRGGDVAAVVQALSKLLKS